MAVSNRNFRTLESYRSHIDQHTADTRADYSPIQMRIGVYIEEVVPLWLGENAGRFGEHSAVFYKRCTLIHWCEPVERWGKRFPDLIIPKKPENSITCGLRQTVCRIFSGPVYPDCEVFRSYLSLFLRCLFGVLRPSFRLLWFRHLDLSCLGSSFETFSPFGLREAHNLVVVLLWFQRSAILTQKFWAKNKRNPLWISSDSST